MARLKSTAILRSRLVAYRQANWPIANLLDHESCTAWYSCTRSLCLPIARGLLSLCRIELLVYLSSRVNMNANGSLLEDAALQAFSK
eukprot:IDg18789t1